MTERELSRGAARRLAIIQHVEEVTGNVAMTCRYFGISRHTYYFWLRRYQQLGPEGSSRKISSTTGLPARDQGLGRGQDHPPPAALPLRSSQDRHVSEAVITTSRSALPAFGASSSGPT